MGLIKGRRMRLKAEELIEETKLKEADFEELEDYINKVQSDAERHVNSQSLLDQGQITVEGVVAKIIFDLAGTKSVYKITKLVEKAYALGYVKGEQNGKAN